MLYYHPVFDRACVAQLAEQLTRNEQVAGSNPATSSKKAAFLMGMLLFYFSRPEAQSRVAAGYLRFLARKYFPIRVEKTPILAVRAVLRFIKKVLRYRFRGWHFQGAML